MSGADETLPIFVYGLLKPGLAGYLELDLAHRTLIAGPDRLAGTLYDLDDYPGALPGGSGTIHGVLLHPLTSGVLADIDSYELFDPADPDGSEYLRVCVTTLGGIDAWTYAYNRSVAGAPALSDGIWPPFAADRGS